MKKELYNILFLGDIFGKTGRNVVKNNIDDLKRDNCIDLIIANGENLAHGAGINETIYYEMMEAGIDVLTSGNHIFDKKEVFKLINDDVPNLLIPANYPPGIKGLRYGIFDMGDVKILIVNLNGRVLMNKSFECPFKTMNSILSDNHGFKGPVIVDFHAEATSEKRAFGMYYDGKISAVIGTHTHVQTADERIQPKGTAYITDVGMCGALESVIGLTLESVINGFLYQIPTKFDVSSKQPIIQGVVLQYNKEQNKMVGIKRIFKTYG